MAFHRLNPKTTPITETKQQSDFKKVIFDLITKIDVRDQLIMDDRNSMMKFFWVSANTKKHKNI